MRVLVISDLHAPYHHPHALDFLRDLKKEYEPEMIVGIGDEVDGHAWSRHDPSPEAMGAHDELEQSRKVLRQLAKLFPAMYLCTSNHGDRAMKAAARSRLPRAFLKTPREILGVPHEWHWASEHTIDGVRYCHGEGVSGKYAAAKMAATTRCNTVIGHIHTAAGVSYLAGPCNTIWGMSVGCLIDPRSPAFDYARTNPSRPVLGTGVVIDGVPHFIPMGE